MLMGEVDYGLIILSMAIVVPSTIIPIAFFKLRYSNSQITPDIIKKSAIKGHVTAIEQLKDGVADTLVFYKEHVIELKKQIKSLQNTVNYYKGRYGGLPEEEEEPEPSKKNPQGISPEIINARKAIIKAELMKKMDPALGMALGQFGIIDRTIEDIANDPDFDNIAKLFISNQQSGNQASQSQTVQTQNSDWV